MAKDARLNYIYRELAERVKDYNEVERKLEAEELLSQSKRCLNCGLPFCHSLGCTLENVIPEMNAAVSSGNWELGWTILSSTSNMPEFTSRVCPALCENACTKNLENKPVMIRQLEKAIVNKAFELGLVSIPVGKSTGKQVAVIGAGPAGLYMAFEMVKSGHTVTVYEKRAHAGGLLRYGIPNFKLDKQLIERRVSLLKEAGVIFKFNAEIGVDIAPNYLKKKFDAIIVAIGTPKPRDLQVKGRQANNIHFALEFLAGQNMYLHKENTSLNINVFDKDVVIIGGGDTGSDCVGTSVRQGAKSITQLEIMPEPPIARSEATPWPDWAYMQRKSSSHEEGGKILYSKVVKEFNVDSNNNLVGVVICDALWEYKNGRPSSFKEVEGSETTIPADFVFIAMGFLGVDKDSFVKDLGLEVDERGRVCSNEAVGSFTCGDTATGQSLVVRAFANAKACAKEVNDFLK